ncbi:unnamed protein product, partial [marine sediment metagenome]
MRALNLFQESLPVLMLRGGEILSSTDAEVTGLLDVAWVQKLTVCVS